MRCVGVGMGSTSNPQENSDCPNCGVAAMVEEGDDRHDDFLMDCNNTNCAVDRFWGSPEWAE